jgi:conjugal transfer pilus assembly protein TraB
MEAPNETRKKQMKFTAIVVFGFIGLLVFGMWISDPNAGKPSPIEVAKEKAKEVSKSYTTPSSTITAEDAWVAKSEGELAALKAQQKLLMDEIERLRDSRPSNQPRQAVNQDDGLGGLTGSPSDITMPPAPLPQQQQQLPVQQMPQAMPAQSFSELPPPPPQSSGALPPPPQAGGAKGGKTIFNVSLDEGNASSKKSLKNIATNLPAGAFGTAVLLSGADAPTGGAAKSNPMPVLLRLMDNGKAPNFWESGIDNCHVTGAAYGEISSERVHIRPEKIICVLLNGDIIEEKISGYVTGEDGKAGMRGRLVERQGALLAKTLFAGIASGTANSINQQYQQVATSPLGQVSTVDPNRIFESGMSSGASSALNKLADYYLERANEMYPIIEIDANRIGELVVTNGVDMGKQFIGQTRQEAVDNE